MIFGLVSNDKTIIRNIQTSEVGHSLFDKSSSNQSSMTDNHTFYFKALSPVHSKSLISTFAIGSISIIAFARIDNLIELYKSLKISTRESSQMTSAQLIGFAYQKYGEKCVHHLVGDWAFAIWNSREKKLFLARDIIGNSSIFYYRGKNFFVFSTYLKQLLPLRIVHKELNPNAILQELKSIKSDSQTFYKNIFQIPCSHTLTVKANKTILENYWLPTDIKSISYNKEEDYIEHFFELYSKAVKCRISNEKMGIALSSGLDSTSVAVLLNRFLPKEKVLEAFTWYPHKVDKVLAEGAIANEVPIAKQLVQGLDRLKFNSVVAPEKNFVSHKRLLLNIFGEPRLNNLHFMGILEAAYQKGIKVLFTGNLGNYSISYQGDVNYYYSYLLNNSFNPNSLAQIYRIKANIGMNWWEIFLKIISYSAIGTKFRIRNKQRIKKNPYFSNGTLRNTTVQQVIKDYSTNTPNLEKLRKANPYPISNLLSIIQDSTIGSSKAFFRYYDMEERAPTADSRLLNYCLGLPKDMLIKNGVEKYIFKKAFAGLLPDYILLAKRRGRQMTNAISKCLTEKVEIVSLFESFKKSPLVKYWLDIDLLYQNLAHLETASRRRDKLAYTYFLNISKGILLGMFLQNFENGKY